MLLEKKIYIFKKVIFNYCCIRLTLSVIFLQVELKLIVIIILNWVVGT